MGDPISDFCVSGGPGTPVVEKYTPDVFNLHLFIFSNCSDVQMFFFELSSKIMEPAFLQAKKIIQKAHEICRPMSAWNEKSQKFARCTEELNESISWLGEAFEDIENFVAGHMILTMPIGAGVFRFV